jgi:excisionase family DNA binding protein
LSVPENRQKSPKNTDIRFEPRLFRADICSGHQKPSEQYADVWSAGIFRDARESVKELANGAERNMADSREVMNIRQASQYLGVSPDTLYKYVGEQRIPAFKLGNRWRFKKSRLDQWMEEKSSEMEPQAKRKAKAAGKAAGQV